MILNRHTNRLTRDCIALSIGVGISLYQIRLFSNHRFAPKIIDILDRAERQVPCFVARSCNYARLVGVVMPEKGRPRLPRSFKPLWRHRPEWIIRLSSAGSEERPR